MTIKDDSLYEINLSAYHSLLSLSHSTITMILNNHSIVIDHVVEQSFIDGSIILDRDKR